MPIQTSLYGSKTEVIKGAIQTVAQNPAVEQVKSAVINKVKDKVTASKLSESKGNQAPEQELKALATMRSIEWSKGYQWGCKFDSAPEPFSKWFPMRSITIPVGTLLSDTLSSGQEEYYYPKSNTINAFSVTFLDNVNGVLEDWIRTWVENRILNKGMGISPIGECVSIFRFFRLNNYKQIVLVRNFYVYPNGSPSISYTSDAAIREISIELVNAGELKNGNGI